MTCERVNYRITCFVLNILFSFLCIEAFSQDRGNTIAELKENYRIVRAENNVRIVRYDGYDDEMPYMLETAKALPSSADVDKENSKLLKHALQKYEVDNSVMLGVVRKHFSNKVDLAFVSFIVSRSGRFEYLYIFLLDRDNRKEKKNLIATPTGVELIQIINEELLKSAELTGIWEKKLREIERRTYNATQFLEELKQMVSTIVANVLADQSNRYVSVQSTSTKSVTSDKANAKIGEKASKKETTSPKRTSRKKQPKIPAVLTDEWIGKPCPLCGKGTIIKGKTAYGCSLWKEGCTFRKPLA